MEMQRWSSRWRTKRWLVDSTITTFITLILVLDATEVKAGKIYAGAREEKCHYLGTQRRPA